MFCVSTDPGDTVHVMDMFALRDDGVPLRTDAEIHV